MNKYVILGYLEKKSAWYHNPLNTAAIGAGVGGLGGGLGRYFLDPKASWGDILGTSAAGAVGGGGLGYVLGKGLKENKFSEEELADAKKMHIFDFADKYKDRLNKDDILDIYTKARGVKPYGWRRLSWDTGKPDPEATNFHKRLIERYGQVEAEDIYEYPFTKVQMPEDKWEDLYKNYPIKEELVEKYKNLALEAYPSYRRWNPPYSTGAITGGILGGLTGGIGRYLLDPEANIWNILNSSALGILGGGVVGGAPGYGISKIKDYLNE